MLMTHYPVHPNVTSCLRARGRSLPPFTGGSQTCSKHDFMFSGGRAVGTTPCDLRKTLVFIQKHSSLLEAGFKGSVQGVLQQHIY